MRCASLASVCIVAAGAFAQTPAFEVATVRPNRSGSLGSNYPSIVNGRVNVTNSTFRRLVSAAYGVTEFRIEGPGWIGADRFDITAKAPDGIPDSRFPAMLQDLLRERFGLAVHRETREVPAFDMVVVKEGLKMKAFDPGHPPVTPRSAGQTVIIGVGTTQQLANLLERPASRPVVDRTGLEGRYSYVLSFLPLQSAADAVSDVAPDLFTAIQEQLGLKLEPKKEPIELLIIDRAERNPVEN
jgi:uncharacterized protein (TIGR03435 family)